MFRSILVTLAMIAAASDLAATTAAPSPAPAPAKVENITLSTLEFGLLNGKKWNYSEHSKNYLVLNFWATWCKPCLKEMPDFQALSNANKDISVLALAYEDSEDAEIKRYTDKLKVRFPVAKVDVYSPLPTPLTTPKGLPTTWIFAPGGQLIKRIIAPVSKSELETIIAAHKKAAAKK
jgi:thiol-disulfide isomerase/thioredoxin